MDNVSFHKISDVARLIEAAGAKLIYLPPHSPELNPIEAIWSKVKHLHRKMKARFFLQFKKSIKKSFLKVTPQDLKGWFQHAEYRSFVYGDDINNLS